LTCLRVGDTLFPMQTTECEAIVLSAMDYGEADRIVTLFTREHGKLRGIARNGKKSVKRFGPSFEIFARIRISLVLKEGLCSLRSADVVTVWPRIRGELERIGYAGYACELVDRFIPEALPVPRLYRLLCAYLEYLDASFPPCADDRRFFEVNLLNIVGYRLSLDSLGGDMGPVRDATFDTLKKAMETGRFGVIRFSLQSLEEAGKILDESIAAHLTRPLMSLHFLREVKVVH